MNSTCVTWLETCSSQARNGTRNSVARLLSERSAGGSGGIVSVHQRGDGPDELDGRDDVALRVLVAVPEARFLRGGPDLVEVVALLPQHPDAEAVDHLLVHGPV